MKNKGFWVAAALSVGLLQTWDSGAFAGAGRNRGARAGRSAGMSKVH